MMILCAAYFSWLHELVSQSEMHVFMARTIVELRKNAQASPTLDADLEILQAARRLVESSWKGSELDRNHIKNIM